MMLLVNPVVVTSMVIAAARNTFGGSIEQSAKAEIKTLIEGATMPALTAHERKVQLLGQSIHACKVLNDLLGWTISC